MKLTPLRLLAALTLGIASLGHAANLAASYQARLQPLLKTYCAKCHGTEKQKAKINLEGARTIEQLAGDEDIWFRVLDQLQSGEMPPDDEKQPSKDERAAMVAWIRGDYTGMLLAKQHAEGRSKLRRLSRTEYANTMEDIFGIRPRVERALPPDGRVDGYDKVAAALPLSSEGSLGYLTMAEDVLGWMLKSAPKRKIAAAPDTRGAKTLREQLALHSSEGSCKGCHARFDPFGFTLESFDVTGAFRKSYRELNAEVLALAPQARKGQRLWRDGLPVDCSGKTSAGQPFTGIADLRQTLAKSPGQLARGVTRHLIAYATGAPPTRLDEPAIAAIVKSAEPGGYGLRTLVHAVVQSGLFRTK